MTAEHSHPPHCCCPASDGCDCAGALIETNAHEVHCSTQQPCPACPEHGEHAGPYTEQETTK